MFVCSTCSSVWIPKLKIELWTSCVVFQTIYTNSFFHYCSWESHPKCNRKSDCVTSNNRQSLVNPVSIFHCLPYQNTHWFLCHSLKGLLPNDLWGMARLKIWRDILGHHVTVIILRSDKDNFYRPIFHMFSNEHSPYVSRSSGCCHIVGHKYSSNVIHTYRDRKLNSYVHAFT